MKKLFSTIIILVLLLISSLSIGQTRFNTEIKPFGKFAKANGTSIHSESWAINYIHSKTAALSISSLPVSIQLNWADPLPKNEKDKSANEILQATYKDMALHFMQFGCLSINIHL